MPWKIISSLLLLPFLTFAQTDYKLHNFLLLKHVELPGQYTASRGLSIQFELLDSIITDQTMAVEVALYSSSFLVFQSKKTLSLSSMDSFVQIGIPYKDIELEKGVHNVKLILKVNNNPTPVYSKRFRLQQPKVFDLFLELEQATVTPDSGYNPIGLNNNAPDPIWQLQLYNKQKKGLVERNSFLPLPYKIATTVTAFDSVVMGVYDLDPVSTRWLGRYTLKGNTDELSSTIESPLPPQVEKATIKIQKLERKPVGSQFKIEENKVHQGVKGIQIAFEYQLPYYFRKKNIRIKLKDDRNQPIQNFIPLEEDRTQVANQIIGKYHYFIAYHHLQNTKQINLQLLANKVSIQQHSTPALDIPKTVDDVSITQKTAHKREGISGILYRLDYQLPELDPTATLALKFPSLKSQTLAKMTYWSANTPKDIHYASEGKIPTQQQQTVFVFLPYFVAPEQIHLQPELWLTNNHIPPIKMATFNSTPYNRPSELSDITIQSNLAEDKTYTGLAGKWFEFNTTIPSYYHSKGNFVLQVLEDGLPMKKGYFINEDSYGEERESIKNQEKITVFIPYRAMQAGKRYQISLQAKSNAFGLSEKRQIQFDNPMHSLQKRKLYLKQLISSEWKNIVFTIGIRNFKNKNQTYPHLGYSTVVSDTLTSPHRPRIATETYTLHCHPKDEIILSFYELGQPFDRAQQIVTSLEALEQSNNELSLKNEENIKTLLLKVVESFP
jgi:hypothetical protein